VAFSINGRGGWRISAMSMPDAELMISVSKPGSGIGMVIAPEDALSFACYLMDWARENWDDAPEDELASCFFCGNVGPADYPCSFCAETEDNDIYAAPAIDDWIEDAIEEYHAAKAEEISEDFTGSPYAINQSGYPVKTVDLKFTPPPGCDCEACREWRMTH
jgi:hypothetical protein